MEFDDPRTTLGACDEAQGTAKADQRKQWLFDVDVVARALFSECERVGSSIVKPNDPLNTIAAVTQCSYVLLFFSTKNTPQNSIGMRSEVGWS